MVQIKTTTNIKEQLPEVASEDLKPIDENDTRCAPDIEFKNGSCMDVKLLSALAIAYNKKFKTDTER